MAFLMVNRSMQIVDDLVYFFTCVNAVNADCYFMSCWRPRVSNCPLCLWQWLVQMKGYLQIIFAVMCNIGWRGKELTERLWSRYMAQSVFVIPRRIFGDNFHPGTTLCYCYCCFYCSFATPERILADHFQWTLVSSDWWYNLGAKNGMQCLTDKAPVWWEWEFRFAPFLSEIIFTASSC